MWKYKGIKIIEPESGQPEEGVITLQSTQLVSLEDSNYPLALRLTGELKGKAYYLSDSIDGKPVDWIIVKDSMGNVCAVPFTERG